MRSRRPEFRAVHRPPDRRPTESDLRAALRREPREPRLLQALARTLLQRKNAAGAIPLLEEVVSLAPMIGVYHEDLARAYQEVHELDCAESEYLLAVRFDPKLHASMNRVGLIRLNRGDAAGALKHFLAAVNAHPPNPEALVNAAVAFNRLGDHERSIECSRLVLEQNPGDPRASTNAGMAYRAMGRREEARQAFLADASFPLARFNLGYLYLQEGDLARGLPLLEVRRELLSIGSGLRKPAWTGGARPGKTLLVIHEQGLGDTILMSRFFPMLLPLFERVVFLVQKPLARLLSDAEPNLQFVTGLEGLAYDYWCPTMSLPLLLGIGSVEDIPRRPWLRVSALHAPGERPRVGINWGGNPQFAYDAVRSTHLEQLSLLLKVRDVEWVSLHKGHLEGEAEAFGLAQPLRDAGDFRDTAAVLKGLDLVISTETAVPNLSAAMGVPTCVLTTPDPDWRWSSWYAGVTICPQAVPGNWYGAVVVALEAVSRTIRSFQTAFPSAA